MRKLFYIFCFVLIQSGLFSQDIINELSIPTKDFGRTTVYQSESIKNLLDNVVIQNKSMGGKIPGYRIQLFSDYKSDARERSLKLRSDFISMYPEFDPTRIYSEYEPPFVKLRVGDYRDENAALIDYKKFVQQFPDCYIVKTSIFFPPL
ncbi:MAG: SPOR domain-containing protein [Salinivirgaceae bacterium]|jgi:hypothetical protein|nr:SPOR domain-containing protein [Bacteroidales bacterium]